MKLKELLNEAIETVSNGFSFTQDKKESKDLKPEEIQELNYNEAENLKNFFNKFDYDELKKIKLSVKSSYNDSQKSEAKNDFFSNGKNINNIDDDIVKNFVNSHESVKVMLREITEEKPHISISNVLNDLKSDAETTDYKKIDIENDKSLKLQF